MEEEEEEASQTLRALSLRSKGWRRVCVIPGTGTWAEGSQSKMWPEWVPEVGTLEEEEPGGENDVEEEEEDPKLL